MLRNALLSNKVFSVILIQAFPEGLPRVFQYEKSPKTDFVVVIQVVMYRYFNGIRISYIVFRCQCDNNYDIRKGSYQD